MKPKDLELEKIVEKVWEDERNAKFENGFIQIHKKELRNVLKEARNLGLQNDFVVKFTDIIPDQTIDTLKKAIELMPPLTTLEELRKDLELEHSSSLFSRIKRWLSNR